ncbi:MAG: hypothetical protein EOM59_08490 [Clostridia bacterium]|nr:hypothetical protein [Clostridia bacterium]
MYKIKEYSDSFLDQLEMFEDTSRGHCYKSYIRQAIAEFLEYGTKDTAFAVYRTFFDSYRITLPGASNPFIDLLDVLKSYEENAATLIAKQRDHYVHSVNVFILGLCVYARNRSFREAFDTTNMDKSIYPYSYDTKHEEFFYRWGLASLFHDVGYPVEIIGKQISSFIAFASEVDGSAKVKSHLEFDNFQQLNSVAEVLPKREFTRDYCEKYDSCVYVDLLKPIDLLAHKLHLSLALDLKDIKSSLDSFVGTMSQNGFIDHGYYSAIIVLKWYGYLIQSCRYNPAYFFYPILDSASAILLHNYYKNAIMKPPFSKERLSPKSHPIAYLLILCDELQEWNREAYGSADRKCVHADEAAVAVSDQDLKVTYIAEKGVLPEKLTKEKELMLRNLLDIDALFPDGFEIDCEVKVGVTYASDTTKRKIGILPRPLLDNLEELAIVIHDLFNQKQSERHPDIPLAYPRFSDLPDTLKYSNLRQARGIAEKLERMGWEMRPAGSGGEIVEKIPDDALEALAVFEHDEWTKERCSTGWVYGEVKDIEKKTSPYILPYEQLPEEIRELDRDTVRNIPALLKKIGMEIYRRPSND